MKKIGVFLFGLLAGLMLAFSFLWNGSLKDAKAQTQPATPTPSSQMPGPGDETPPPGLNLNGPVPNANLPTPIPGETLVYFTTSDSDATGTVLVLLNTDTVQHTVALRGYTYSGVLGYSLNVIVNAGSFVRLSSDSISAAPPPSWATPAPLITNFTDFTYFASLSLPKGVKVEGYTIFNPGTGTVDPRADQGAIPIRFSTDPATVFLPAALN
jgi:hypothetical protein